MKFSQGLPLKRAGNRELWKHPEGMVRKDPRTRVQDWERNALQQLRPFVVQKLRLKCRQKKQATFLC